MMRTLNDDFMQSSAAKAREGLMGLTQTRLFAGLPLYRFGNSTKPQLCFTGPWWLGFSPFEALKKYARLRDQPLTLAARQCLAIDWGWSQVDVLVKTVLKQHLSAWAGTPKTQVPKVGRNYGLARWEPDRDVTQLYIPGLAEADPQEPGRRIWQSAFATPTQLYLG
jgi:hypothetical protein